MKADVEIKEGEYKSIEMGEPVCGEDFCDSCGDCLHCYGINDGYCNPCRWVIYKNDKKNPLTKKHNEK